MTDLSEGDMLHQAICMLCEGTGESQHGPHRGEQFPPCNGSGKMADANHRLAVQSWREHRRRRQVTESAERRDLV